MKHAYLLIGVLAACPLSAQETPDQIARELGADHPHVARIFAEHPEMLSVLRDGFWADALLRSPTIPGTPWRSHDLRRPQPQQAVPGFADCPPASPPSDADILLGIDYPSGFVLDGGSWTLDAGVLTAGGQESHRLGSIRAYGDMQLHLEFRTPSEKPLGAFQYRGNSGVFLMGLYEVQLLDSWHNPVYPDGMLGALYGQKPPLVNASLPPGRWQCIDIIFRAPQFEAEALAEPARISVAVNGIAVQEDAAFLGPSGFGGWDRYARHAARLPFALQDHGDSTSRVSFRNIWVRDLEPSR